MFWKEVVTSHSNWEFPHIACFSLHFSNQCDSKDHPQNREIYKHSIEMSEMVRLPINFHWSQWNNLTHLKKISLYFKHLLSLTQYIRIPFFFFFFRFVYYISITKLLLIPTINPTCCVWLYKLKYIISFPSRSHLLNDLVLSENKTT